MNIYIYGAGEMGSKLAIKLKSLNVEIVGFIDSYKNGMCLDIPIVKLNEVSKDSCIIIALADWSIVAEVARMLSEAGYTDVKWHNYFGNQFVSNNWETFLKRECINVDSWGDTVLPHLEFHIADNCNLNCKGCTHFSPLYCDIGMSFDERISGLELLLKKVSSIAVLDILGGEPFLNPDIIAYIVRIKELLPNTFVDIFTNGLMIPKLSDEVLTCIRDYDIPIFISEYEPTHKIIDVITQKLDEYGIRYRTSGYEERQKFNLPISTSNKTKHPLKCISKGCVTLEGVQIARCPTLMYIKKFNEVFNHNLPCTGIISLNSDVSGKELLELLEERVDLCNHCVEYEIEWEISRKKLESDFSIKD